MKNWKTSLAAIILAAAGVTAKVAPKDSKAEAIAQAVILVAGALGLHVAADSSGTAGSASNLGDDGRDTASILGEK